METTQYRAAHDSHVGRKIVPLAEAYTAGIQAGKFRHNTDPRHRGMNWAAARNGQPVNRRGTPIKLYADRDHMDSRGPALAVLLAIPVLMLIAVLLRVAS